jgi:hypothetical protein
MAGIAKEVTGEVVEFWCAFCSFDGTSAEQVKQHQADKHPHLKFFRIVRVRKHATN